ncbi:MAG: hypothetical protein QOF73_2021 [Thermomicrobiales bacterium]|nr:hypothetical protein [Thermomicrobiales bacterium]
MVALTRPTIPRSSVIIRPHATFAPTRPSGMTRTLRTATRRICLSPPASTTGVSIVARAVPMIGNPVISRCIPSAASVALQSTRCSPVAAGVAASAVKDSWPCRPDRPVPTTRWRSRRGGRGAIGRSDVPRWSPNRHRRGLNSFRSVVQPAGRCGSQGRLKRANGLRVMVPTRWTTSYETAGRPRVPAAGRYAGCVTSRVEVDIWQVVRNESTILKS